MEDVKKLHYKVKVPEEKHEKMEEGIRLQRG